MEGAEDIMEVMEAWLSETEGPHLEDSEDSVLACPGSGWASVAVVSWEGSMLWTVDLVSFVSRFLVYS